MKKVLSFIVVMTLMVVMGSIVYADGILFIDENFDDSELGTTFPDGWSTDTPGGTVEIAADPVREGNSVKLVRTTGSHASAQHFLPQVLTGRVIIEANIRLAQKSNLRGPNIRNSAGAIIWEFCPRGSGFLRCTYNNDVRDILDGDGKMVPYDIDRWYHVKIDMDTDTGKFDLYLDGEKIAEQYDIGKQIEVASIGFDAGDFEQTFWFDDVIVYNE